MGTTFLKRQKEMKRQEKQREKAERRAQKKLTGGTSDEDEIQLLHGPPHVEGLDEEFGPVDSDSKS